MDNQVVSSGSVVPRRQKLGCAFWLLPISALLMLGATIWYAFTSYNFVKTGVEVEGVVIRQEISSDEDGTSYSPVFRYIVDG